jgi:hypothetical protein
MRTPRFIRSLSVFAAAVTAATLLTATPALADTNDTVTPAEVATALTKTDNKDNSLIGEPVPSKTDIDSAATTTTKTGTVIDIPKDAGDGVTMGVKGEAPITIGLPDTDNASDAQKLPDGTIVYAGSEGVANAVVPTDVGPQMLVNIANNKAPTKYRYPVTNGKPQVQKDGSVVIKDSSDKIVGGAPAPYAREVHTGRALTGVRYTVKGNTVVLHVPHTSQNVQYPIIADPWWIPVSSAAVVAAFTAGVYACGLGYLAGAGWQIFWNGWVWNEVRRAGREGCVEGIIVRFMPISWFRALIKRW